MLNEQWKKQVADEDAYVFPVQDAGLQIYMRTLDIQFIKK